MTIREATPQDRERLRELYRDFVGEVPPLPGIPLDIEHELAELEEYLGDENIALVAEDEGGFPLERPWDASPVVAEVAVPPSKLDAVTSGDRWGALAAVGLAWVGVERANGELDALRGRAHALGGIAPAIKGPGGLGSPSVAAPAVQRRLKDAFDPNGVLAPGRFWDGL